MTKNGIVNKKLSKQILKTLRRELFRKRRASDYSIEALIKAIEVVEYLAHENESKRITEIARAIGLPHNQVFRIMQTLEIKGWAKQGVGDKNWTLSKKFTTYPKLQEESEREQARYKDMTQNLKKLRKEVREASQKEKMALTGDKAVEQSTILDKNQ